MAEEKQKISEEESPSVESKEGIEQNENLWKDDGVPHNKEFQETINKCSDDKESKISCNSTKANNIIQNEEKNEGNENPDVPTHKLKIILEKVKSTKRQRKKKKTPKFNEKNKHKKLRGHIKIFEIKKVKDKKDNFDCPLKFKTKVIEAIPHFLVKKISSSNGTPPCRKKKLNIRESSIIFFLKINGVFNQKDDDEKLKKEDYDVVKNMCTNHDGNYFTLLIDGLENLHSFMSTNYSTN